MRRRPGVGAGEDLVIAMTGRADGCPLVSSGEGVTVEALGEISFEIRVAGRATRLGVLRVWELHALVTGRTRKTEGTMDGAFQMFRSDHIPIRLSGCLKHSCLGVAHQTRILILGYPFFGKAQDQETHQGHHSHIYFKAKDTLHQS
jgi:hypothetical protein